MTTPQAVIRHLKAAGYVVVSAADYNREGIKVKRSASGVRVWADVDDWNPGLVQQVLGEIAEILRGRGYDTDRTDQAVLVK